MANPSGRRPGPHNLPRDLRARAGYPRSWTPRKCRTTHQFFSTDPDPRGSRPARSCWRFPRLPQACPGHPPCRPLDRSPISPCRCRRRRQVRPDEASISVHRRQQDGVLRLFIPTPPLCPRSPRKAHGLGHMPRSHLAPPCRTIGGRRHQDRALIIRIPFTMKQLWRSWHMGTTMRRRAGW